MCIFINSVYAAHLYDYGGQISFTAGRIAGQKTSDMQSSGYAWITKYYALDKTDYLKNNFGISFERSGSSKIMLNDVNIGYHRSKDLFIVGRSVNAAGYLHHDITDFGAPGGGSDNTPISYFFSGNFTTNVAQQLAQPFSNHIAYYIKPIVN